MLSIAAPSGRAFKLANGWLTADNTDEAMGMYTSKLRSEFEDYAIEEILVLEIPENQ